MKNKIAVVLFNLGGPSDLNAVRKFLFNLFYDRAIIDLPNPFRFMLAQFISILRNKKAKKIYSHIGGKSPILEETKKQADAIEKYLNGVLDSQCDFKLFISMRYWKPFSYDTIPEIIDYNPEKIILVPLYPQFSTTTTASSINNFMHTIKPYNYKGEIKTLGCYFASNSFINAHVELIQKSLNKLANNNFIILFSAHGLPISIIKKGDPYQWQIEQSVEKITTKLNLNSQQYLITYQSRVGPMKWLEPRTEDMIEHYAKKGIDLIIVPISFVSEHSETLVELDIEYKEIANAYGANYYRVPALTIHETFIDSISQNILSIMNSSKNVTSDQFKRLCPEGFNKCICRN